MCFGNASSRFDDGPTEAYSPEKKAADFGTVHKCDKSELLPTNN
jgi:hypothetical protein